MTTGSMGTLPFALQEAPRWSPVKERADVVGYNADGLTALHYAAYYGNIETVRVILKRGSKTEGPTERGRMLMEMRTQGAHSGLTPLHIGCYTWESGNSKGFGEDGWRRSCNGHGWTHTSALRCRVRADGNS
mmetsp:Transcript_16935/g.28596  ORF Transcript_16935/g.28596 Transcript_16935/m.28596 type:complete len:132 (-) Transcript_16935:780-1175(-)